jgi:acyl-homoserine lactone acylase PvdQ
LAWLFDGGSDAGAASPQRGLIVTANNRPVPLRYPHFLGHAFSSPDRATRIEVLLRQQSRVSIEQIKKVQLDVQLPDARVLLPHMLALVARERLSKVQKRLVDRLRQWDYQAHGGSIETTCSSLGTVRCRRRYRRTPR